MSRWLVGMSGDKDAMISHLEKCEKRKLEQFALIKKIAGSAIPVHANSNQFLAESMESIIELCDVFLDKRSDKQKLEDQIYEMRMQTSVLQERIEKMEGDSECGCC